MAASGGQWNFVAYHTGLKWSDALENESTLGRALIHGNYGTALRSTAPGAYNSNTGEWKQYDPTGMPPAAKPWPTIWIPQLPDGRHLHHLRAAFRRRRCDPRTAEEGAGGCAWATDAIIDEFIRAGSKEELEKQKQIDLERLRSEGKTDAANSLEKVTVTGVSPIYLAVKARSEIGTSSTQNATGYPLSDGKKYYNFFNHRRLRRQPIPTTTASSMPRARAGTPAIRPCWAVRGLSSAIT